MNAIGAEKAIFANDESDAKSFEGLGANQKDIQDTNALIFEFPLKKRKKKPSTGILDNIPKGYRNNRTLKPSGHTLELNPDDELDVSRTIIINSYTYPLLTAEQEVDLAKRIERGDLQAKKDLINSNLRLVASQSKRYYAQGFTRQDLTQEGTLGLIRASEKFDWRKGFKFSTYATLWIRQAIQRGIQNHGRFIHIPVHMDQIDRKIRKAEFELRSELGREPSIHEIADSISMDVERILDTYYAGTTPTSLDKPVGDDGESTFGEFIVGGAAPEEELFTKETQATLKAALDKLSEDQKTVIKAKYLSDDGKSPSHRTIGTRMGITSKKVSELEKEALQILGKNKSLEALDIS